MAAAGIDQLDALIFAASARWHSRMLDVNAERYGQAFFNVIAAQYPELAEQIRGTIRDPFYYEINDPRWHGVYAYVENYFGKQT